MVRPPGFHNLLSPALPRHNFLPRMATRLPEDVKAMTRITIVLLLRFVLAN